MAKKGGRSQVAGGRPTTAAPWQLTRAEWGTVIDGLADAIFEGRLEMESVRESGRPLSEWRPANRHIWQEYAGRLRRYRPLRRKLLAWERAN